MAVFSLLLLSVCEEELILPIAFFTVFALYAHLYLFEVYNDLFKLKLPYLASEHKHKYVAYLKNVEAVKKNVGKKFFLYELLLFLCVLIYPYTFELSVLMFVLAAFVFLMVSGGLYYKAIRIRNHIDSGVYYEELRREVFLLKPQVLLHFGGGKDVRFQVDMWASKLQKLNKNVLVVVRRSNVVNSFKKYNFPVLFVQTERDIEYLLPDSARVALFTGNTANNLVLIRTPKLQSIFIGHGDSDKAASSNNVSRIYNYIFVAGQLAIDRYVAAKVGIDNSSFKMVGRPQLDVIKTQKNTQFEHSVLLYAPTWEGWSDAQNYSSLLQFLSSLRDIGDSLDPSIKILFRPHPFTGRCNSEYSDAINQISSLLNSLPGDHESYIGAGVDIYELFNKSTILVTDISSVLSDFYASEKPVFVSNPNDFSMEDFKSSFPSASGCYSWGVTDSLFELLQEVNNDDWMHHQRIEVVNKTLAHRGRSVGAFNSEINSIYRESIKSSPLELSDNEKEFQRYAHKENRKLKKAVISNSGGFSKDRVFWLKAKYGWVEGSLFSAGDVFEVVESNNELFEVGHHIKLESSSYNYRKNCYKLRLDMKKKTKLDESSVKLKYINNEK